MSDMFISNLPLGLKATSPVERRLLAEYGAMFVAENVDVPCKIVFRDEADVAQFQSNVAISSATIGGMSMQLQTAAMDALLDALEEAEQNGCSISPRDTDSARRGYDETVGLWASRVYPALDHWVSSGKLGSADAARIRSLPPFEQVPVILELEEKGIFFAKDLSKSILYSVAPPGTSQHLAMLAFDIKEHEDPVVRGALAKHRWYQTVVSDLPHFTFLGMDQNRLAGMGLKSVSSEGRFFWVPDI